MASVSNKEIVYNDYNDMSDEEAKAILEWFIHTEFLYRKNTKEGIAIVKAIKMFEERIKKCLN